MRLKVLVGAAFGVWVGAALAMPPEEVARVERLIARVEASDGTIFIRNGTEYTAKNAAQFLRRKCGSRLEGYANAEQFVRDCASRSSTSGDVYRIRLQGAAQAVPSAEVLGQWLAAGR